MIEKSKTIIKGKWYSYKELCKIAKDLTMQHDCRITGKSLCDDGTYKKCNGGYGMNILHKLKWYYGI